MNPRLLQAILKRHQESHLSNAGKLDTTAPIRIFIGEELNSWMSKGLQIPHFGDAFLELPQG